MLDWDNGDKSTGKLVYLKLLKTQLIQIFLCIYKLP